MKRAGFALIVVTVVVSFFTTSALVPTLPHQSNWQQWAAAKPWSVPAVQAGVTQAGVRVARWTHEDLERWIAGGLVAIVVRNFIEGARMLIDARDRAARELRELRNRRDP